MITLLAIVDATTSPIGGLSVIKNLVLGIYRHKLANCGRLYILECGSDQPASDEPRPISTPSCGKGNSCPKASVIGG